MSAKQLTTAKFKVKIFSPYQTYFEGEAVSVSAKNKTGPFDILYNHAKFLSLLVPGEVTIDIGYQKLQFVIYDIGIIKVSANQVTIFVSI